MPRLGLAARLGAVAVAGAALAAWLGALVRGPVSEFDDAYMFVRYARNVADGAGLVWNRGAAPVFGATSLPYVLVVAAVRAFDPAVAPGRLIQIAAAVGALVALALMVIGAAWLARLGVDGAIDAARGGAEATSAAPPADAARGSRGSRESQSTAGAWQGPNASRLGDLARRPSFWAATLVPLVTLGEVFRFHVATGMDTTLSLAANAGLGAAAIAFVRWPGRARTTILVAAGYGAYLVRPDNAIYAVAVPLLAVALFQPERRRVVGVAATLAGLFAIDALVKRLLLGSILPLSFQAKRPGAYAGFAGAYGWNPFLFLRVFVTATLPFSLACAAFARRHAWRPLVLFLAPLIATTAALFSVNPIMGHLGRLFFPGLPFVVFAAVVGLQDAPAAFASKRRLVARLALVAALAFLVDRGLLAAGGWWTTRGAAVTLASLDGSEQPPGRTLPEIDSWQAAQQIAALARELPPGTRFAMSEHGLPGAVAPDVDIVDLLGLHDPAFSRRFSPDDLMARHPALIWLPHPDHTQMIRQLLDSAWFRRDYDFYPEAFLFGLAVRRDPADPQLAILRTAVGRRFAETYPGLSIDDFAVPAASAGSGTLRP